MTSTRLLLVDDDDFVRPALTRALNRTGAFQVTPAEHGQRALDILDAQPVDAILTDLQMPVMDGLTMLGHLLERGLRIPVAVMTGQRITPQLADRLRQYGIAASFSKPIELADLADALQRALSPTTVGRLTGVTMFGFLQLIEVERKTALIVVRSAGEEGRLYFDSGVLVHGETPWHRGLDAVFQIVGWSDPRLEIFYQRTSRERTIHDPLQHVLMEAARLLDESMRTDAAPPPPDEAGTKPVAAVERAAPAIQAFLADALDIEGAIGAALVDASSGVILGTTGSAAITNLELASAGAAAFVRTSEPAMARVSERDAIDDLMITLGTQYHVVRRLRTHPGILVYLVLDRKRAIVGMARQRLAALARRGLVG